ncbi:uncharacterized protein LOC125906366 [Xyrichtys novacula]|uniref:Uncharacterized protein LOC125906366 n=1 Tax=Xyrichtys novacula TaxID=13765 RepID=A0AAV1G2R8_XYRNO|nr:uncharacterized protein LOC125906366 [Xyrichtys novacula]
MAPLCLAVRLPLLIVLLFILCSLFVARIVSPLRVYDRLTLLNIRDSVGKSIICGSDGHSKTPPPLLASIPPHLRRLSCCLPRKSRRRRRGKRGGILVKVKAYLASVHDPRRFPAGSLADYNGYDLRSSTEYRYRWLRPVLRDTGVLLPCCRPVRISQRGCVPGNLRSLSRFSRLTDACSQWTGPLPLSGHPALHISLYML